MVTERHAFQRPGRAVRFICLAEGDVVGWLTLEHEVRALAGRKRVQAAHPDDFGAVDKLDGSTFDRIADGLIHVSAVRFANAPAGDAGVAAGDDEPPARQQAAVRPYFHCYFITVIPEWVVNAPHVLGFGI